MVEQDLKSSEFYESAKSEFVAKLERLWAKGNFVCVGLDSDYSQIPESAKRLVGKTNRIGREIFLFNQDIIDATHDLVCAYKPNVAFYEAYGNQGFYALAKTIEYIKKQYYEIPVILDAKRGDISNANLGYVKAAFDELGADAATVNPYFGKEALQPFLDRQDKGIFVLVRTSDKGAGEFQDLLLQPPGPEFFGSLPFYKYVAYKVASEWNENGNCGLVVGATYPEKLTDIRQIVGNMPILIPGVGAQGGDIEKIVQAGKDSQGCGIIVNSSSGIIFASKLADFAQAARKATECLREEINKYQKLS